MKFFENIKIRLRADKYKRKDDAGGIAYLYKSIRPGQTVLDIGAHKAGYLYHILNRVGKSGKVVAFEPQSALFHYIRHIRELFNWSNVTVEHLALSDTAEEVTLYIPVNKLSKVSSPGATIVEHRDKSRFGVTERVRTQTLDAYCTRNNIRPDFLKIDVEGNELRVLYGGISTLLRYRPKLLVEIDFRHAGKEKVLETFSLLHSLGYKGHFICGFERIPLEEFSFEKHQNEKDNPVFCNNFTFEC